MKASQGLTSPRDRSAATTTLACGLTQGLLSCAGNNLEDAVFLCVCDYADADSARGEPGVR